MMNKESTYKLFKQEFENKIKPKLEKEELVVIFIKKITFEL